MENHIVLFSSLLLSASCILISGQSILKTDQYERVARNDEDSSPPSPQLPSISMLQKKILEAQQRSQQKEEAVVDSRMKAAELVMNIQREDEASTSSPDIPEEPPETKKPKPKAKPTKKVKSKKSSAKKKPQQNGGLLGLGGLFG